MIPNLASIQLPNPLSLIRSVSILGRLQTRRHMHGEQGATNKFLQCPQSQMILQGASDDQTGTPLPRLPSLVTFPVAVGRMARRMYSHAAHS